ncbi:hypothetical protein WK26_04850 [Burkholderia vietnamiensis]|uniref:Uncharacterized protein n=1 Tax=Burkholderia ubonensis TaxID=101571 RepID=A0A1B4LA73_9BURK|nr:hypothetical protein WJ35_02635 [Burkholderia ubonensis]KVR85828.1 hypothetical protein WK26_04850 [Burkholderia vietnamiensis]
MSSDGNCCDRAIFILDGTLSVWLSIPIRLAWSVMHKGIYNCKLITRDGLLSVLFRQISHAVRKWCAK